MTWINLVQIHLRCFYSVVMANSKLDLFLHMSQTQASLFCSHFAGKGRARYTQCFASFPSHPALSVVPLDSGTVTREWYCSLHNTDEASFCSLWLLRKFPVLLLVLRLPSFVTPISCLCTFNIAYANSRASY